jgi:hypothetical protein
MAAKPATFTELGALINGYLELLAASNKSQARATFEDRQAIHVLLNGYEKVWNKWAEGQKRCADDFNILDVLGVADDELRHSAITAP